VKRISYAEDHVVTGDAIADAVMSYAQALAVGGRSDSVELPGVDDHGVPRRFTILIGPASQMLTSDVLTDDAAAVDEVTDDALVDGLESLTRGLAGPSPVPVPRGEDVVELDAEQFDPDGLA